MKKIDADECDAAFALTFFLTILMNMSLPALFHFLQFFWKEVSRLTKIWLKGIEALRLLRTTVLNAVLTSNSVKETKDKAFGSIYSSWRDHALWLLWRRLPKMTGQFAQTFTPFTSLSFEHTFFRVSYLTTGGSASVYSILQRHLYIAACKLMVWLCLCRICNCLYEFTC